MVPKSGTTGKPVGAPGEAVHRQRKFSEFEDLEASGDSSEFVDAASSTAEVVTGPGFHATGPSG